ncbi:MAG: DVU_1551 family NTP transferase [Syntrophales bacterium]|jgi:CTP:molybdopterin cytidylyltransferase MocA
MEVNGSTVALILAAGYSSRMGEFKPLLPMGEFSMIERSIAAFLQAGISDIRVVVGYRADTLIPVLTRIGVRPILNENFSLGMYSSVQAGVRSLGEGDDAFFLLPADYPLIRPETVAEMLDMHRRLNTAILYPTFHGRRGHPPLIAAARYIDWIILEEQPQGLRSFLASHERNAVDIEVDDEGILIDLDTIMDYQMILDRHIKTEVPCMERCLFLLKRYGVSEEVIAHSRQVSMLSREIAIRLKVIIPNLDETLVAAASLLHDLAKGKPHHAEEGMRIIKSWGYTKVATIVGSHTDIILPDRISLGESEILFLADKLVKGVRYVTLDERFQESMARFGGDADIAQVIRNRYACASIIKKMIEIMLGTQIESILPREGL